MPNQHSDVWKDFYSALEKIPLSEGNIELSLSFGPSWPVVKELRQIFETKKKQNTPDLVNREQELIQFLLHEDPTAAEKLRLPRVPNRNEQGHDETSMGRASRSNRAGRKLQQLYVLQPCEGGRKKVTPDVMWGVLMSEPKDSRSLCTT